MAGYSGTPLLKKLGISLGMSIYIHNAPENYFELLGDLPEDISILKTSAKGKMNFIHLFSSDQKSFLKNYERLKPGLLPNGMLWISWPKKSSGIKTDLTENFIRDYALANGLVDVKVCAVDEIWSGLKLVYRLKDRIMVNG